MDFDTRPAAYAVILREGQVLLAHWSLAGFESWTLPGGGIEVGESPAECCRREVLEETGYEVEVGPLVQVGYRWVDAERRITPNCDRPLLTLQLVHTAEILGGELECETEGTTNDVRWVPLDELDAYARTDGWPVDMIRKVLAGDMDKSGL